MILLVDAGKIAHRHDLGQLSEDLVLGGIDDSALVQNVSFGLIRDALDVHLHLHPYKSSGTHSQPQK